ncbi:MAG: GTPase Era [Rhodothermaceae bacterium]|nr:GTPase Era [Rhodothermaceae bacterium]
MEPILDLSTIPADHKSGYVALVGAPNVGKSTLMNRLLGTKLSIVTEKPSTTRHRILGILSDDAYQIIFLDTPGVIRPKYRLHDLMLQDVDHALADADVVVFLADATAPQPTYDAKNAVERLDRAHAPLLLALNKMDLIATEQALPLVEQYTALKAFEEIIPISAKKGTGLDALFAEILERIPHGPPYYPKDQLSEHPERFFIAEIVREAVFKRYRDEVPYSTQVNVMQVEEREDGKDLVACEIVVERDSQKGILIGKGGQALKHLGADARRGIEAFLGREVFLQLHVKTRADWRNREGFLRSFGYGR